jgi:oligopeptide/dipeptide ABC transporter ATP-binding protein
VSDAPRLRVRGLSVAFTTGRGRIPAVDDLGFDLAAGECLAIVGESGSGKSVSCLAMLDLLRRPPAEVRGSVVFRSIDLLARDGLGARHARGRGIGMVFQDPLAALSPFLGVGFQIEEAVSVRHPEWPRRRRRERVTQLLAQVGLPTDPDFAARPPHRLSGGQRQRVGIAIALGGEAEVLLLDEPTTALDVTVQAEILELLARLARETSTSMVLVTHDLGVAAALADHVLVLYAGRVLERAPAPAFFAAARHPYSRGLLGAICRLDAPPGTPLAAIPGSPPAVGLRLGGCVFEPRCPRREPACATSPPPLLECGGRALACPVAARDAP